MIELFPSKNRTDLDPAFDNENPYLYYDRSARSEIAKVRELLNGWFNRYPAGDQAELKSRFLKTFSSAFYELFIYQLFLQQGFSIEVHPTLPNSSKRPDFLISNGTHEFYLEAKEAKNKSQEEEALDNMANQLYDHLNKIKSPNFNLYVEELLLKSKRQPSAKKIIKKFETEINKCNPDEISLLIERVGLEGNQKIMHEDSDVKIKISLIPKLPAERGTAADRPIGMYPMESFWGGSQDSIKDSFSKKAKRYGKLNKPYFICINSVADKGHIHYDADNSLWGSWAWTWSTDPKNRNERFERIKDGIFLDKNGPRHKHVTGVLITKATEFNIADCPYWFAKHPFSDVDFDFDIFKLSYLFVAAGQIQKKSGATTGEIFNLATSWMNEL